MSSTSAKLRYCSELCTTDESTVCKTPTEVDLEWVVTYAKRAIEVVDAYEAGLDVQARCDEVSVAARFDGGRIVSDVDHLVVTPDVDYKTNDTIERSVDDLAEHYWLQLRAYAVALH